MKPQRYDQIERTRKRIRKLRFQHYRSYHKRKTPEGWVIL